MNWLWIPVTIWAAFAQTVRNAAQRSLTAELGTLGATPFAGAAAAGRIGEVVSVQVIPRPHEDLGIVLPPNMKKAK